SVTGNWNGTTTWQRFDGSDWVDWTGSQPTNANGRITVRSGANVTITTGGFNIDQVVVEAGATVTQSTTSSVTVFDGPGTDLRVHGPRRPPSGSASNPLPRVTSSALIQVDNGGLFERAATSTSGTLPVATWHASSTLRISTTSSFG